jgi:uncharacterized protein YabE (DUF348 family)/3D (Asp-Asp-Asp) domain-containing protein
MDLMYKNLKDELKSFFTISTKAAFIAGLITMACVSFLYSMQKTIVINIDGKEQTITTYKKDLKNTLIKQNIVLGPKDKVMPAVNTLLSDGDKVNIKRAVSVNVLVDGKEIEVSTSEDTIKNTLKAEGITYSGLDRIEPSPDAEPEEGMKVCITRVESVLLKEYQPIDFTTIIKNDNTLSETVKKVSQEGEIGEKELTFMVMFENGKEVSKKFIQELVIKEPVERVLLQGTLRLFPLSRGGEIRNRESFSKITPQNFSYSNVIHCEATAYSSQEPGIGTITASGKPVKRNPNGYSTIAVDPKVIPMGTRVYVDGYGYATAEDTGGAIKGNKIDVYLHTISDCIAWGRRGVNVYILE